MAGEFYINLLHFEQNKKVQNFINLTFQFGLVPTANTPIRITKISDKISATDHTVTNSIINNKFKTAILTADTSDHFPIVYAFKLKTKLDNLNYFFYERIVKESLIKAFKFRLGEFSVYDEFFPKNQINIRHYKNSTPWILRGTSESSKPKQKLLGNFLKNCTLENQVNYITYRRLFESIKQK